MKKTLLLPLLFFAFCGKTFSQIVLNPIAGDPVVYTGWTLAGTSVAVNVDSAIQLTASTGGQSGRVYYSTAENVTACGQFTVNFDFRIIPPVTGLVADGISFFFLSSPVGTASTGMALDIPPNPNGLVLVIDTYDNNGDGLNPEIPLYGYNGSIGGYTEGGIPFRLGFLSHQNFVDDGSWHHVLITYNGGNIKVYFNYSAAPSITAFYPITTAGQFGFSGSTGGAWSKQEIKNVYISANTVSPIMGNTSICQGATSTLSDSTAGGTWSSSNTAVATVGSTTGVVTGAGVGTATISYTFGTCSSTIVVTVNTQPAIINGTFTLCEGASTTLTDATGGGVWSSTNTAVATISAGGTVTASSTTTGTTTISYLLGSCVATQVVTVSTQPAAITGNTGSICEGATLSLSDATGGGVWSSVTTTVATISGTGLVTASSSTTGTSVISYTIGGCASTTIVTVNTQPAIINGTFALCEGASTTLTDATGSGVWSSTNTAVATISAGGTVTASSTTTGTTTISYLIGSCVATQVVTVNTQPAAITGNTGSICEGATLSLSDATGGGVWSSVTTTVATISGGGLVTASSTTTGTSVISYTIGSCVSTTIVTVNTQPAIINGTFALCEGASTTLTDATGGGVWSSTNTTVATISGGGTVTASSTTTGTTTISYLIGSCVATQDVTVNTQPAAITGNTGSICEGATLSLSDATGGGVWSSVTTTVATISGTGLVTASSTTTGTSVISYTIGGCVSITIVTVNTQPAIINGTFALCEGASTTLTDATGGGIWSSTNTAVATISAGGTVTASSTTTGTTTISYLIGSCVATQDVTVTTLPAAINGNTGSICEGATLSLSDATGGGVWSSVTTTVATISGTGLVTASSTTTGTSIISYTIGSCAVTTIVTVNIQPVAISGAFSLCEGSTTTLTDATGGGIWSSTNTSVATISGGGTVTASSTITGTTTISYLIGSCVATQVVTVTTQPAPITGTLAICEGFTSNLSDITGGGVWSSVTTTVATISGTGVVTASSTTTGTSVISYTIGSCAVTTIVTVNTQPTAILGTLTVCQGLTTALTDATGGGVWTITPLTTASVTATGVVTGIAAGTATITYKIGSCDVTAIVTVEPLPAPITGIKTVCSGFTTNLFDGTSPGTWSSSNVAVATIGSATGVVTGQVVAVTSTATITYTIGTGCIITTVVTVNPLPTAILGANAVCLGSTVTLSDAGGGTWGSANGAIASITGGGGVTGNGVGVTTITYTLPTGCYITAPMTVNPLPVAISGPILVCVGSTITLSDGTGGGTWSSSNTGVATVGVGTGVVSGLSIGTTTISYILGTGCYITTTVTVNAPPAVITPVGDTIFCPGGFVALTANTGAGLTYQWYVGGVAISGAAAASYIASIAGSYQVLVTNAAGCSTLSIPMSVTIDTAVATITAGSSTTICSGSSVTLSANTGAGLSYQWLLGGAAISGAVGSSYTTSTGGDYSVIVTIGVGCSATSSTITVSVNPSPLANITLSGPLTFCQGDSVVMTTDTGTGYTYQWYNASGAIGTATGVSYTATVAGTYSVLVTNSYGCTAASAVSTVVVNPLPNAGITASGPTIFCAGGSVTLTASAGAGFTYQWYLGGTAIAGATNLSYVATTGGGYQVQVTNPATGCTAKTLADTMVTVVATPVVIPLTPSSFCWGSSSLLSTSVSGATGTVLYQWYFNGAIIPGATGATYNATTPGNYSCQITIPGSCVAMTLAVPVTEFPLPNPVVTWNSPYFHTGTFYVTYQWYKDLVAIPGATASFTPATGNGNYKVSVTDTNGCQSYSDVYVYTGGSTTYVQNVNTDNISIYPNPAQTMVHIESAEQVRAVISSIDGREILNVAAAKDIDISDLAEGIYMIMLYDDSGSMLKAEKMVKIAK